MDQQPTYPFGAMVCRICPVHKGHQMLYEAMAGMCTKKVIFVGSANAPWSLPVFFNYQERSTFFRTLYPKARIVPLPDFETNSLWLCAVRDLLVQVGFDPGKTVFFGGCEEDVLVLRDEGGFDTHLLNRFDGTTPVVSATEVRDALIHKRSLGELLDPKIQDAVRQVWDDKWPHFLKKR